MPTKVSVEEGSMRYNLVDGSGRKAPRFTINVGLREGYGSSAKTHSLDEVVSLVEGYLRESAAVERPYLTGSVTAGEVVYAWPEGDGKAGSGHEPQAIYSGNINPLYNSHLLEEEILHFLKELASILGSALGQTRVYIEFDNRLWVLQAEDRQTPTGD